MSNGLREGEASAIQELEGDDRGEHLETGAQLLPIAWVARQDLTYKQWVRMGQRFGLIGRGAGWWIGDWVRYGSRRYGGRYRIAMRATGYDEQTLMNMVWVASRIEISRRRENLSFSHHAEVAALDPEAQDYWLARAERERFTVRKLRNEIVGRGDEARTRQRSTSAPDLEPVAQSAAPPLSSPRGSGSDDDGLVTDGSVCPNCGVEL